jgi:sec-independent protein translocase protein TatC
MSESNTEQQLQTLTDHLVELRDRLIKSAWAVALFAIICFTFSEHLFDFIRAPIAQHLAGGGLIFTNPMDKFVAHIKVSLMCGVILACPVWIYQAWRFIAPGLYANEKKYSTLFIAAGTGLFATGVMFAYFLVLPTAFHYLLTFGGTVDKPMITINEYLSFFTTMILVFGGAFELPLVIVVLGAIGLVSAQSLRAKRRFAIVALAIFAAVITPPDALSMLLLLVPLVGLYEISILLVAMVDKKRQNPI